MAQDHYEKLTPEKAQQYLSGIEFPAKKDTLVDQARANGADHNVMSFLERIPDRSYDSPTSVSKELENLGPAADKDMDNKAAF